MRLYIKVIPKSSQEKVEKMKKGKYKVFVRALPEKGRANQAVVKLLAEYFQVPKYQIKIIAGKTTRIKIVDVVIYT